MMNVRRGHIQLWLGIALLIGGLAGHGFAAEAIGGHHIADRDHLFGFFILTVVAGGIIAALGWRFWKGRHDDDADPRRRSDYLGRVCLRQSV